MPFLQIRVRERHLFTSLTRVIQRGLSRMIGFFGGVVTGEWLPTFRKNYPAYMDGVELDELEVLEEMSEK